MDICRVCLAGSPSMNIYQLNINSYDDNKGPEILLFCLDIQHTEDTKMSDKLCEKCFKNILSFYQFKTMALRNDACLRSIDSKTRVCISTEDEALAKAALDKTIGSQNEMKYEISLFDMETEPEVHMQSIILPQKDCVTIQNDDNILQYNDYTEDPEIEIEYNLLLEENVKCEIDYEYLEEASHCSENECLETKDIQKLEAVSEKGLRYGLRRRSRPVKRRHDHLDSNLEDEWDAAQDSDDPDFIPSTKIKTQTQEGNTYICPVCVKSCDSLGSRSMHIVNRHFKEWKITKHCKKDVLKPNTHMLPKHEQDNLKYKCGMCEQQFEDESEQTRHNCPNEPQPGWSDDLDSNLKDEQVAPDRDDPDFIPATDTATQTPKPKKGNTYGCPVCFRRFDSLGSRSQHITNVHFKEWKISEHCDICNKDVTHYRGHMSRYHEQMPEKKYKCKTCERRFGTSSARTRHTCLGKERQPPEKQRLECKTCKQDFASNVNLQAHMIHTKEKPYKCPKCGKAFTTSSGLAHHNFTHAATKEFTCNVCSKSFGAPTTLRTHKRIHIPNKKKFPCRYCDILFGRDDNRKFHERTKHGDLPLL